MKRLLLLVCCFVLMTVVFASCVDQTPPQNEPGGSTAGETTAGATDGAGDGTTAAPTQETTAEPETEDPCLTAHDYQNRVCSRCGEKQPSEGLKFQFNEFYQGYLLDGLGTCEDSEVVIPSVYEGKPVIGIVGNVFQRAKSVTKVSIPDSVITVDGSAFQGCTKLIEVEGGVSYVDGWVITCDKTLASVDLRDVTRGIASYAFSGCSNLTSIELPDRVRSISPCAFEYCRNLQSIGMPEQLYYLGGSAFNQCLKLESIAIPEGVTIIGLRAFGNCRKLTSLVIPEGVTTIQDGAFQYCTNLQSIFLPKSVTKIGAKVTEYSMKLEVVYYDGTKEEWDQVEVDKTWTPSGFGESLENGDFILAVHYYSENDPGTSKGRYWHYVDGVPTPW